jgi:hypothetical protein
MNKNVYKGNSDPVDILKKQNPSSFVAPEELVLDQGTFALTDPIFIEKARKEGVPIQSLFSQIEAYYDTHLERGVERFE